MMTAANQRKHILDFMLDGKIYSYREISSFLIRLCREKYNNHMQMSIPSILDELKARGEIIGNRRLGYQILNGG